MKIETLRVDPVWRVDIMRHDNTNLIVLTLDATGEFPKHYLIPAKEAVNMANALLKVATPGAPEVIRH